jgi:23S rRNA (guanosine2251-2'-O)-methyltransferase
MIFGAHPVLEAIESGKVIERIYIQRGFKSEHIRAVMDACKRSGLQPQIVPEAKLKKFTRKNHQGVVCLLSPIEYHDIRDIVQEEFEGGKDPLVLILDRITDVRNFGSICRTAECLGVSAVLIPDRGSALISGDAVKTSAGALLRMRICREPNIKHAISFLKESGLEIVSSTEKSDTDIYKARVQGPLALILGSEEDGVSPEYLKLSDQKLRIPMQGEISSLNVAVATGIFLSEINRQRYHQSATG